MICLPLLLASMAAQETPAGTVKGLATPAGLTVMLWASEPQFYNPTNIDIDERGRVWVLEAVNYRRQLRKLPDHRGGDRIVILEDTNLDGRADKVKVFDEGPHLRSPLGIAVLGDKVIVSQSPDVFVYTRDAEDRVVSREVFLTGFRGVDHDHGVHAFVFGPDGRYYFNAGDEGLDVADRSGTRVTSSRKGPYYAGTALRINRDGTGFTVLGHNFRNPYELAVDSFGHVWQSDNDDDGNAWTRLNYVLAGGNFGYWGPGGRSWFEDRSTHFHQENPGVVPNIARMGAGSPCGMTVYEGSLLPDAYRSRIMHAEAGKRFLNTYTFRPAGAGYTVETEQTVRADDMWFRPSDVAVGPDGAVYIADWYDPAVGGHQMGDTARGRIYRLAPAGFRPSAASLDLESEEGLAAALASPAQSVRYLAWMKLHGQGPAALPALLRMARRGDALLRARALWLLAPLGGNGEREVRAALRDPDPNFRVLALRALAASGVGTVDLAKSVSGDPSPIVLREAAVMLSGVSGVEAVDTLATLALRHNGRDRWYLAALGIGARGKESEVYARLRERIAVGWTNTLGQLAWEMRPPEAIPFAAGVFQEPKRSAGERQQALDALAAQPSLEAARLVAAAAAGEAGALRDRAFEHLSRRVFSEWSDVRTAPEVRAAAAAALKSPAVRKRAIEFIADLGDASFNAELLALANDGTAETELRAAAVRALGSAKAGEATFQTLLMSAAPNEVRAEAVRNLGRSERGITLLLDLEESQKLPAEMRNTAMAAVQRTRNPALRARGEKLLPVPVTRNKEPLPAPFRLLLEEGDPQRGRKVFESSEGPKCSSCHTTGDTSKKLAGPDLADIGAKLGKDALLDSILFPSAGIAHEYQTWILETSTQGQVIGIIAEDTPQRVVIRNEHGEEVRLRPAEIRSRRRSSLSLMPEDLATTVTARDLIDLLSYLAGLKGAEK